MECGNRASSEEGRSSSLAGDGYQTVSGSRPDRAIIRRFDGPNHAQVPHATNACERELAEAALCSYPYVAITIFQKGVHGFAWQSTFHFGRARRSLLGGALASQTPNP